MARLTTRRIISLPNKVYKILKRLSRKRKSSQSLVERVRILLLASRGENDSEIARQLGIGRKKVLRWCQRWLRGMKGLANGLESASSQSLEIRIRSR